MKVEKRRRRPWWERRLVNFTRPTERRMGGWATRDDVATMCQRPRDRPPSAHVHTHTSAYSSGRVLFGTCQQDDPSKEGKSISSKKVMRLHQERRQQQTRRRGSLALRPCSRVILASVASRWRYRRCTLQTLFESTDAEGALTLLGRFLNYVSRTFVLCDMNKEG